MSAALVIILGTLLLLACCRAGRDADEQMARLRGKDGNDG